MSDIATKPAESRRDRRFQKKRDEILEAATRVFAQKGFASATTKDIADEADIGESTLYNYFDSKRDILISIMDKQHAVFDTMLHEASGLAKQETLTELVEHSLEIFLSRVLFTRTILSEAWIDDDILKNYVMVRIQQMSHLLADILAEQIKMGTIRPVDPALVSRLAMGMFIALVLPVLRGVEEPFTPEQRHVLAETMVTVLLDGIRNRDER